MSRGTGKTIEYHLKIKKGHDVRLSILRRSFIALAAKRFLSMF